MLRNKKVIVLSVVLLLSASLVLVGCGGGMAMDGGDNELVGEWDWNGSLYYTFEAGGSGTMAGSAMRWSTDGNVLSICGTPASCGSNCILPTHWDYELNEDELTLTGLLNMTFTYTRR